MKHIAKLTRIFLFLIFVSNISLAIDVLPNFADVVEPLLPTVVNIYTVSYAKVPKKHPQKKPFPDGSPFEEFNEMFEQIFPFGDESMTNRKSLGSGFIIDGTGYIVTNHHVIDKADEINVKFNDNTEFPAKVVGSDPRTDVALLKIDAKKPLPFLKFADSSKVRIGEWVVAIGNPFGIGGTVTAGIVSGKSRDIDNSAIGIVDDYIQTDAAINEGNSGGPLFNEKGDVIGVNTMIFIPTGGNIGIGFAIPSNTVNAIVNQLKTHGKIVRGVLNIGIQDVTPKIAESLGIKDVTGVLVTSVEPDGAGAKAGLILGDIIIEFAGNAVKNTRKLQIIVAETAINTETKIKVLRNNKQLELTCKIAEDKKNQTIKLPDEKDAQIKSATVEINGIVFSNITEEIKQTFGIKEKMTGVVVMYTKQQDAAWTKFLKKGDVITSINLQEIKNVENLNKIYQTARVNKKENILMLVKRQSMTIFTTLPIGN